MFRITINNTQIDLQSSLNIVLNKQLFDYSDVSKRYVTYSNAIVLLKTATNIEQFSLFSNNVYENIFEAAIYYKTALELEGFARVIEVNDKDFKIQIVGKIGQFFEDINTELYKLDLSSDDFVYNFTNYSTLKAPTSSVWFWPLVNCIGSDYTDANNPDLSTPLAPNLSLTRPSLIVYKIIQEIIENQGYTANFDNISDLDYDLLLVSAFAERFTFTDIEFTMSSISATADTSISFSTRTDIITPGISPYQAYTDLFTVGTNSILIKRVNSSLAIRATFDVDAARMEIWSNNVGGELIESFDIENGEINIETSVYEVGTYVNIRFDRDLTINSIKISGITSESDYYNVDPANFPGTGVDAIGKPLGWLKKWGAGQADQYLLEDYTIKASYNLPRWTQKTFLLEFMNIFNLKCDIRNGQVIFDKVLQDDITDIYTVKNEISRVKQEPYTDLAKRNEFIYSNDESVNLNLGNKAVYFDNDLLQISNTVLQLNSSATLDKRYIDSSYSLNMANVPILNATATLNENEDRLSLTPRFYFYAATSDFGANVSYKAYFGLTTPSLDLGYIYDQFYSIAFDRIYDFISNEFTLKLSYLDWLKISTTGIIYDQLQNRYLRVLEIQKFNSNRATTTVAIPITI